MNKIYHIHIDHGSHPDRYDYFDAAVVVAADPKAAKIIAEKCFQFPINIMKCNNIGWSKRKPGPIMGSFNAG